MEKPTEGEAANVFDCVTKEQWARQVMVFGHETNTGGFIASGHGVLDGMVLTIKLASGRYYRINVDSRKPYLQPLASPEPARPADTTRGQTENTHQRPQISPKGNVRKFERKPASTQQGAKPMTENATPDGECEDLTEEDLRRLRGELPLTAKPKKVWRR